MSVLTQSERTLLWHLKREPASITIAIAGKQSRVWEQSAETEGRPGDEWNYRIKNLYPIEDDKDSANASEVVDWGDCVWQPASIPVTQ